MTDRPRKVFVCAEFEVDLALEVDDFHEHGNQVMDELLKLEECNEDVRDSAVSTDAADRIITLELVTTAEDDFSAIVKALTIMRTAAHAVGGGTSEWPEAHEVASALAGHYRHRGTRVEETTELAGA